MGNIYRKAAMDRLASPEQLDKMIRIASPSLWIAVAGAGLMVVCVLVWAIFGSLPTNVDISGMYMSDTGVNGAYAAYGGTVSEILVEKNETVEAGDVLAVVVNQDSGSAISQLEERIAAVEAITLTSKNDSATSDVSQLLEYKLQYQQSGLTKEQKEENLKALQQQLERAKEETASYKASMEAAEAAYLASIGNDGMNSATFNYQKAQTELTTAQNEYQTLYSSVANLESTVNSTASSLQSLYEQYTSLESQYDQIDSSYDSQLSQMNAYQQQYNELAAQYEGEEIPPEIAQQLASLENSISALSTSSESLYSQLVSLSDSMGQISESINSTQSQLNAGQEQLSSAQASLNSAQARVDSAQAAYNSAESVYQSYYTSQNSAAANQTELSTAFNEASQLYSNAYSTQESLEQQIEALQLETGFEAENATVSRDTLKEQFTATKEAILKDLNRELNNTKSQGAVDEVTASVSGTVVDCSVEEGQLIGQGTELFKVKSGAAEEQDVVRCYVPLADGKKLEAGMNVVVTPSTVSEDEYGHMIGTVESVGTYSVSSEEVLRRMGDESLASAISQQGPSVEVILTLEEDADTVSGYAWSNKKGETVAIEENTPVTAKVRVKEDAPISKLIPFLKEKLDVTVESAK